MLRRNILIFHNAALGDYIVTWPLAMACGRLLAQSRVIYVTSSGKGKLAEHVLGVESADIEAFSALWSDPAQLAPAAKKLLDGSALIFSFVANDLEAWAANARSAAPGASIMHLSTRPPQDWNDHVSRAIAAQLGRRQPAIAAAMQQMIDSLSRRGFASRPARRGGVLIHPGSGAERKNWPRQRFVELARRLTTQPVRIVLGEVEIEKWGVAARDEFAGVAQIIQPASLIELAGVTAEAGVVVCNDAGPAHLAGIMGVPTLALFGPTSHPTHWRPLGPEVKLLVRGSLEEISVDEVLAAVTECANPDSHS